MNRTSYVLAAGLICSSGSPAQTQPESNTVQQQRMQRAQSLDGGRGGRGGAMPLPRAETGRPFSATVITQTTQTLPDGTHVSQTITRMEYRDAEGRVRTEISQPAAASGQVQIVTIRDPLHGVSYRLDPANKTAVRLAGGGAIGPAPGGRGGRGGGASAEVMAQAQPVQAMQTMRTPNDLVEDLGTMTINGVAARGTRTTTVVPAGAIGNDREFRSVSERWFSSDLNLLVKSVNTDPRFGATTYELTNISRQAPDPSLFEIPADYHIVANTVGQ
jgi:hypothetical protein